MTDADDTAAGGPSSGRHGGAEGGLSAAELIARARAGASGTPDRPSRASRRAAEGADGDRPRDEPTSVRHLTVVEDDATTANAVAEHETQPLEPLLPTEGISGQPFDDLQVPVVSVVPPPRSRAGRNLPAAIGVGAGLGLLILGTLFSYRPSFVILVVVAILLGAYEMVVAISTVEARPPMVPLLVGAAAMDVAAWFRGADGLVGALLLTVLGIAIWRLADGAAGYLRDIASGNFIALYVPFLAGFAILLAHPDDGAARVVLFILAVVCSDTGGYITGVFIGRHPMAPTVSPKKSWEGFVGSVLAAGACGVLIMVLAFHHPWWQGALFGFAVAVTATLGDLGESMIKRDLGLKDMGRLLPGHGGIMDRLDSLLPCAPVAYLLLTAFVPH
jgi:phosphatidate cytidylyltransferase